MECMTQVRVNSELRLTGKCTGLHPRQPGSLRENLPTEWHFLGKRKVYGRCLYVKSNKYTWD